MPNTDNSPNWLPKQRTRETLQAVIDRLAGCAYAPDVALEQIHSAQLQKYITFSRKSDKDS